MGRVIAPGQGVVAHLPESFNASSSRGRRLTVALAGLAALGLGTLLLAEVVLRVGAAVSTPVADIMRAQDPAAIKIEPHGEAGYRQRPGMTFRYRNGTAAHSNGLGYRGPEVAREKPTGTIRVILLGGSSAHGWAVNDDQSIDAYMRAAFAARWPGHTVEVVNLAFDGYDSWQDFERLRTDGVPLSPDVVIMHSGINDVRNARFPDLRDRDPRTMLWLGELERQRRERVSGPSLASRAKHWSYVVRTAAHVRQQIRRQRDPTDLMHPGDVLQLTPNLQAVDYFERNVSHVVDLARQHGFALILSTPPSSLNSRYAPDARSRQSYWVNDARTTQALRDSLDQRFRRVADSAQRVGLRVRHVSLSLAPDLFLDDCHLAPEGNRAVADGLVNTALALLADSATAAGTTLPQHAARGARP